MIDLLVISHACLTKTNRHIYQKLQSNGRKINLAVPSRFFDGAKQLKAEPRSGKDENELVLFSTVGRSHRLHYYLGIVRYLRKAQPKAILVDLDPASLMTLVAIFYAGFSAKKIFSITCENQSLGIKESLRRRGLSYLLPLLMKRLLLMLVRRKIETVFTINDAGTAIFKKLKFKSVKKIPLGFSEDKFFVSKHSRLSKRHCFGFNGLIFAYFGRMHPDKAPHLLLMALSQFKQYDFRILIDKFTRYENKYTEFFNQKLLESGLQDRVIFINPSHENIGDYMNAADIVVCPSRRIPRWEEQYGRVIPEAMACGCFPIVSDTGALPELVAEYGLVFSDGDVNCLADQLKWVFDNKGLVMSESGKNQRSTYSRHNFGAEAQKQIMEASIFS
jgi:glycosyltransferase involved in cell wall biosynthesis